MASFRAVRRPYDACIPGLQIGALKVEMELFLPQVSDLLRYPPLLGNAWQRLEQWNHFVLRHRSFQRTSMHAGLRFAG